MLVKAGVDISRLERNTRRALTWIDSAWRRAGKELIITSTYEGNHMAGSLHYANQAFDLRYPSADHDIWYKRARLVLPADYDIVAEKTHLHVEYDPKGK